MKLTFQNIWAKSKWHLLAGVFTFAITWFGNVSNFMHLATVYIEQIKGTQYGVQLVLCTFGSLCVAVSVEIIQGFFGKNKNAFEWREYARPDIIVTTASGFIGSVLAILIYLLCKN